MESCRAWSISCENRPVDDARSWPSGSPGFGGNIPIIRM